jgi:hypothetical protein
MDRIQNNASVDRNLCLVVLENTSFFCQRLKALVFSTCFCSLCTHHWGPGRAPSRPTQGTWGEESCLCNQQYEPPSCRCGVSCPCWAFVVGVEHWLGCGKEMIGIPSPHKTGGLPPKPIALVVLEPLGCVDHPRLGALFDLDVTARAHHEGMRCLFLEQGFPWLTCWHGGMGCSCNVVWQGGIGRSHIGSCLDAWRVLVF